MDTSIFLLHTHFLPFHGCDGILVAEQDSQNFNKYYDCNITSDLSLKGFFTSAHVDSSMARGFSIEKDLNIPAFLKDIAFYKRKRILSILPYRNNNETYYYEGRITDNAKEFLKILPLNEIVLDCTHMPANVVAASLDYYSGPLLFSHSVIRSKRNSRSFISNEISDSLIPVIKKHGASFLIGFPVINDIISLHDPVKSSYLVTIDDLVEQVLLLTETFGIEHVGIGGDYFNFDRASIFYGNNIAPIEKMQSPAGYSLFKKKLKEAGYSDEEISAIFFDNAIRFFKQDESYMRSDETKEKYWSFSSCQKSSNLKQAQDGVLVPTALPTHAWFSLSNYCNLSCKHCRSSYRVRERQNKDIPDILYQRMTEEVLPGLESLIIGGNNCSEVTRSERFPAFVSFLKQMNKRPRLSIQTNGSVIPAPILLQLTEMDTVFNISVEGGTQETTQKIRGFGLDYLSKRIAEINKFRMETGSHAKLVLSFTAMKSTISELPSLLEFAEYNGVDEVNLMFLLPPTPDWNNESVVSDYLRVNQIVQDSYNLVSGWHVNLVAPFLDDTNDAPCYNPWTSISVNADGEVRFCCLEESPSIGNLIFSHFADVWNSPVAQRIRQNINVCPEQECAQCVIRNLPKVSINAIALHHK